VNDTGIIITSINSGMVLLGVIFTALMTYFIAKLNVKTDGITKVGNDIHTLVNSNMGSQLKITMILADRVADLTKASGDILAATEAHKLYEDHIKKQEIVDSKT